MDGDSHDFTAIRGVQAGSAYYVIMVPLKIVPRLFKFEDEAMPATVRAQRVLNRARVPAIASYIVNNANEYILSSLCASIDGEIEFLPAAAEGPLRRVGQLRIDMGATILINDGQHRRAAIEEAIRERPSLGNETISVVVFADRGLKRSQQMFADLNIHAVKPTRSIKLLYNHRDALAALSRDVVADVALFRDFTCYDSTSISNRSTKFFTLSSVHQATMELIGKSRSGKVGEQDKRLAIEFWTAVISNMPDWQRVAKREVSTYELRRDCIHAHGVAVQAIGKAGAQLIASHPKDWKTRLVHLRDIDWSRANRALWDNRALVGGKVNISKNNVTLVTNVIIRTLGMALTSEAQRVEDLYSLAEMPKLRAAS
ncbi:DNA sulfur modification protein DndB [Mesorhizobium sp. B2-4-15]|uniref:DNA sulfur modification protein DndB n=1 Tax=Mesorhizobium sp. B2-4-15 TaxID=2589934 RepID=UPI001151FC06|nr:DNA sulfur modification protein DndB [Mesorhizobium sp. B2-4-15]TPK59094.1 DNA sulfur modification protein DndB [Mesorhizobium sp. B2-4-15]